MRIYVAIRLRYNHRITYIHHVSLHTTVQILRRHHSCFYTHEITVSRVSGSTGFAQIGFSSIRESFLCWVDIWTLVVTCSNSHQLWQLNLNSNWLSCWTYEFFPFPVLKLSSITARDNYHIFKRIITNYVYLCSHISICSNSQTKYHAAIGIIW